MRCSVRTGGSHAFRISGESRRMSQSLDSETSICNIVTSTTHTSAQWQLPMNEAGHFTPVFKSGRGGGEPK